MKYRKKPVEIEAVRWDGSNLSEIEALGDGSREIVVGQPGDQLQIVTLEGIMTANPGDWVICGVAGELYPCKPDIFDKTYEEVRTCWSSPEGTENTG